LPRQRFDGLNARLARALQSNARAHRNALERVYPRLKPNLVMRSVSMSRERLTGLNRSRRRALQAALLRDRIRLDNQGKLLASLGYHNVLARGFTLIRDEAGRMLRRASEVSGGQALDVEFADGHVPVHADQREGRQASKPRRNPGGTKQGTLL
jgi:exodeoxyribonuclease VII large subunit